MIDNYLRAGDYLCQTFTNGLGDLCRKVDSFEEAVVGRPEQLFAPLSPVIDVDSPSFRYESFWTPDHDVTSFGTKVDAARRVHVEHESEIHKRLGGAS